jgi:predicted nucleic acid-binding Zn finger protein
LPNGVYRFRQVMPMPLGEEQLGPENPELVGARQLSLTSKVKLESTQKLDRGFVLVGKAESNDVEVMIDLDGRIRRGRCGCSHFRKFGIRKGPCRHMIALRYAATSAIAPATQAGAVRTNGFASRN